MKKNLKAILTVLCAAVLALNFIPAQVKAGADNTGYIMFNDESGTYQYWSDAVETGVVPTDVTITGPGVYTVGLDFTGTADGKASGVMFTALAIKAGETNFPGYTIEINSIKINGNEIEYAKGYTSSDDKVETRMNIYNAWVGEVKLEEARSFDGVVDDGVSPTIIDPADFAEVETYEVTFTLYDAEGNGPAEEAPVAEAPATDVPKTGVVGLGLVYGLGALVTGAVVLKRKEK